MLTLAIDTSHTVGSIALCDGVDLLEERILQLGQHHGQALIPEIRELLLRHGRTARDCQLLAVSIGPGSFTGLRVGIVCAKTLAYATGCPIAAVNTLTVIAQGVPADVSIVHVISDAQRGDLFLGRYTRDAAGTWTEDQPVKIVSAAQWQADLSPEVSVCGPALDNEPLRLALTERCRVLDREFWLPRARHLALLGQHAAARGQLSDPWQLEPLYLRKSAAEEKWEARQQSAL